MTVALTASFRDIPSVRKSLEECTLIYSTQVSARDELYEMFGESRVKFIPTSDTLMIEYIKSRHPGCTFLTYSDVFAMWVAELVAGNEEVIYARAKYLGWTITTSEAKVWEGKEMWKMKGHAYIADSGQVPTEVLELLKNEYSPKTTAK